jgi:microcystin-dependent protein
MADNFVAEIRIVPFNFAPTGWALCDGQLLPISQNTALFSLLGTQYGGDGRTNFALPNLQGSGALHTDQFAGGGQYPIGSTSGETAVSLLISEMPAHAHTVPVSPLAGRIDSPSAAVALGATGGRGTAPAYTTAAANTAMASGAIGSVGGSSPHNNLMPYVVMNYIIALQGIYPPRT